MSAGREKSDLWIQALTYFRMAGKGNLIQESLKFIGKQQVLSPLLVLEILQQMPGLEFRFLKEYLVAQLQHQHKSIVKNKEVVDENMGDIGAMRDEIKELKTSAKLFNQKVCDDCALELGWPTVHFMCGHVFHEHCAEGNVRKKCPTCAPSKGEQR